MDWQKIWQAENLVWKIPLENLENSEHGKSGGKSAETFRSMENLENLRILYSCGKSAEKLENLENLECKVYLTFHGKSGARYSAENLTLICLENLQKMLALFIVMW